jgi:1-acyl-sn-glycerol-3-phosphate acyltransferase
MKFLKDIVARLMASWALLLFVLLMLVFFIPIWLAKFWPEPKSTGILISNTRLWMRIYFALIGLSLKVKGKEYFAPGENYIVVSNHNSLLDVPLTSPFIPGINKTIAKIEMSRIPLFGMIYKRGSVLVDRKDEKSRKESYAKMKQVLDLGMHMCIYPEGTRNKTNAPLKEFHDGAFRLAFETKKAIVPTLIFNTRKALPNNRSFYFMPTPLQMHFLEPVKVQQNDTAQSLKEKVFRIMWDYYAENSR